MKTKSRTTPFPVTPLLVVAALLMLWGCGGESQSDKATGSAQYVMSLLADSTGQCGDSTSPCARISYSFPEITRCANPHVADVINSEIQLLLLGEQTDTSDIEFVEDIISGFLLDYDKLLNDFPDYRLPWIKNVTLDVVANGGGVLSLEYVLFEFTGGAHPNTQIQNRNFDLETGQLLTLHQLLLPGADTTLTRLAEKHFRMARQLAPDADLAEAGFWFENGKFVINGNFLIDLQGLTFAYNAYEIAPYSMGPTGFTVPYNELRGLINPEGPLVGWLKVASAH